MNIRDESGRIMDAVATIIFDGTYRLTIESRGGDRNKDYIPAFRLLLVRLAKLQAVLTDAVVDSKVARALPPDLRRIHLDGHPFPISLVDGDDAAEIARQLRRVSANVAREPGAEGSGNTTKRCTLSFTVPQFEGDRTFWVAEQILTPEGSVESAEIEEFVRPRSFANGAGQGFLLDPRIRRAIELHAMTRARAYFEERRATVRDVSANSPYDLQCLLDGREIHVEVKGTTGAGLTVLLTANEVAHARSTSPNAVLYILAEVIVDGREAQVIASGGREIVIDPWDVDSATLTPTTFRLTLA